MVNFIGVVQGSNLAQALKTFKNIISLTLIQHSTPKQ